MNVSEHFKKNSLQIYNLLKVLNANIPLENLTSINDVYDNQADLIEEIVCHHKIKMRKVNKKIDKQITCNESIEEQEELENYFENQKKFNNSNIKSDL